MSDQPAKLETRLALRVPDLLLDLFFFLVLGSMGAICVYALLTPDPCFYGPGC